MKAITLSESDGLNKYLSKEAEGVGFEDSFIDAFTQALTGADDNTPEKKELGESVLNKLKQVTYTIGKETVSDKAAAVTIDFIGFDFEKLLTEIENDAENSGDLSGMEQDQAIALIYTLISNKIKNASPNEMPKTIVVPMSKSGPLWIIDDAEVETILMELLGMTGSF
jgi:hypothetical protein